ncbi:ATP-binding protein [Methanoculleus sp.]|uniref:ATP-binding protein n=1 Tax=Methanoculleus sp. TaxID=90427 RepID=UPI0025D724F9|nr:ATP-binding protein [Methanoculleus sp.]
MRTRSGAGVPDDDKERIFRWGYGKNTGFGLAFARDILSLTGISIRETGTASRGARFEVLVPPRVWRPHQED